MVKLPEHIGNLVRVDLTDGQLADLRRLYVEDKLPTAAIGDLFGIAATTVAHRLRALGVTVRPRGRMKKTRA